MIQLIKSELITDQCSLQLCLLASFNCNKKQTNKTQYYIQGSLNKTGNNGNRAEWSLVWSVITDSGVPACKAHQRNTMGKEIW